MQLKKLNTGISTPKRITLDELEQARKEGNGPVQAVADLERWLQTYGDLNRQATQYTAGALRVLREERAA